MSCIPCCTHWPEVYLLVTTKLIVDFLVGCLYVTFTAPRIYIYTLWRCKICLTWKKGWMKQVFEDLNWYRAPFILSYYSEQFARHFQWKNSPHHDAASTVLHSMASVHVWSVSFYHWCTQNMCFCHNAIATFPQMPLLELQPAAELYSFFRGTFGLWCWSLGFAGLSSLCRLVTMPYSNV